MLAEDENQLLMSNFGYMGVWNSFERSYCDVRVTHHGAQSHMHKSLAQLHAKNEREKNTLYADRIKQVEKSVFHALIFNTYGERLRGFQQKIGPTGI